MAVKEKALTVEQAASRLVDAIEEHASTLPSAEGTAHLNKFQQALTEAAAKHHPKAQPSSETRASRRLSRKRG
jgi:hypothetical protein